MTRLTTRRLLHPARRTYALHVRAAILARTLRHVTESQRIRIRRMYHPGGCLCGPCGVDYDRARRPP